MTKEEGKIIELENTVKQLRKMFDEILYDDNARASYQKIDTEWKAEEAKENLTN